MPSACRSPIMCAHLSRCRKHGVTSVRRQLRHLGGEHRERLLDARNAPRENLLHCCNCHRGEQELRKLTHIEAARTWAVLVDIVYETREIFASCTRHP